MFSHFFDNTPSLWHQYRVYVLFLLSLVIAGAFHGTNMFYYPYYESDEGTYLSQAYSIKTDGELAPYVYWYDHPPFGWMTLTVLMDVVDDKWISFGSVLNNGRVLMLILHLIQVSLIFFLVYRVSRSPWLAFLSILLYSLPMLTTYFQRRVLLDNVMITYLLLSISLLYIENLRFQHVLMSGVFYGLAFLTKVTSAMFGPAILLLLLFTKMPINKGFRVAGWLSVSISMVSLWFLYALFKTEFFIAPEGERVSLIGSVLFQASRETGYMFWEAQSSFRDNLTSWLTLDATTTYVFIGAFVVSVIMVLFSERYRFFSACAVLYAIFLLRGGVVIGFYILPIVPFLVISIVGALDELYRWGLKQTRFTLSFSPVIYTLLFTLIIWHYGPSAKGYLTTDETTNQTESMRWIKENVSEDATMIIDVFAMPDLRNPHFVNEKVFMNADWYFKVAKDPEIRYDKYLDDWRNFDYVYITHEMLFQTSQNQLPVIEEAIRNSQPLMQWDRNSSSFIDIQNFLSTNGDWTAVHQINDSTRTQLLYAWNHYRENFIHSYGQVIDPQANVTTSEGQSYAMLQAVLMNDEDSFKGLWLWTQHQLQHRISDDLISWKWADGKQVDSTNATDADIDIALALIFAATVFNEPSYIADALVLLESIWEETVVDINGTYYLVGAEKVTFARDGGYLINPSYFSPAHYRIFAEVDTLRANKWLKLAEDSYSILNRLRLRSAGVGLPPNWIHVDEINGSFKSAQPYLTTTDANHFGYDAFRVFWRVALDQVWFDSLRAEDYLKQYGQFFENEWRTYDSFATVYSTEGRRLVTSDDTALTSGILPAITIASGPALSSQIYNEVFVSSLTIGEIEELAYWGDGVNYYDLSWNWLGLALFNDKLTNIWRFYQ